MTAATVALAGEFCGADAAALDGSVASAWRDAGDPEVTDGGALINNRVCGRIQ